MAVEVLLPKIGLTMQEGTIDEWLVPAGTAVAEGEALLRLATDKVDVDVEAEAGGLFHPVVPAGATVPAGALIGWLLAEGEQPPDPAGAPMPAGPGPGSEPAAPGTGSVPAAGLGTVPAPAAGPAVVSAHAAGPAVVPVPAVVSASSAGPAVVPTSSAGPAVVSASAVGPAVVSASAVGPAAVPAHAAGPAVVPETGSVPAAGPAVVSVPAAGPAVVPASAVGPAVVSASAVGPAVVSASAVGPAVVSASAVGPAVVSASAAGPAAVASFVDGAGFRGRRPASPNARRVAAAAGVDLTAVRGTGPGGRVVSEDVEDFLAALPGDGLLTPAPADGIPSSPLVRKLAKERGIDLGDVSGTGPGGRVRRADLDAAAPPPRRRGEAPRPGDVLPLTGMRGTIARRMHASLQEMAQLTHGYEVRMDAVVSLRDQLKQEWTDGEPPVPSLNDFLLKAAALALREHPLLNATVREDGVHLLDGIHLGFAVAVPGGLMVPVIEDAAALPLPEITRRSRSLAQAAREGRISPAQLEGATFTVTSLGGYGVDFFTPVINPGNVAILGVGRLKDGVEWADDRPLRTRVLTLSLTFDHRAVDGAPAAAYLRTVGELLRRPLRLLV